MYRRLLHATLPTVLTLGLAGPAAALDLAWESAVEFKSPECVVWDAGRGVYYVSNLNAGATEKTGTGFVSRVGPDGKVLDLEWVGGLNSPKGMAQVGDRLYVAEVDSVSIIDLNEGRVVSRLDAPEAKFLNDVAAGPDGVVYITDMVTETLWRLEGETLEPWLQSEALLNPNGVYVDGERLIIGAWGDMKEDFSTEAPGHLLSVSLADGGIEPLGEARAIGNLDGVEPHPDGGWVVTDWMSGGLVWVPEDGAPRTLVDLAPGSADHALRADQRLVIVPLMKENRLVAYRLP